MDHVWIDGYVCQDCGHVWSQRKPGDIPTRVKCQQCKNETWQRIQMCLRGAFQCDGCGNEWAPYSKLSPLNTGVVKCYNCNNFRLASADDLMHVKATSNFKDIQAIAAE